MPDNKENKNINLTYLRETISNEKMIFELLGMFQSRIPGDLKNASEALEAGQAEQLYQIVHKMKAAFMIVGIKHAKDHIDVILKSAKENELQNAKEPLQNLKKIGEEAIEEIKQIVNSKQ